SLCAALNLSDILVHGVFANEKPQARQNTNVHLSIFILEMSLRMILSQYGVVRLKYQRKKI
ncbi:hypothetical protein, partial [Salmonella enterica]|uniref:hypothetical protein n=1 Tax=Salmonella enterica TaxID=28901 RepID=UPI00344D7EF7